MIARLLRRRPALLLQAVALIVSVAAIVTSGSLTAADKTKASESAEVLRARREIKLLDDIYKTAIVLITKHYVDESSDLPAGEAFKVLFAGMKEKGWHEVRLLDATGEPLNEDNRPQDEFERQAIKALLAGQPYYEEQAEKDGQRVLRAVTPLPIVMEKCTLCHSNYTDQKVIGGLGYALPLEIRDVAK